MREPLLTLLHPGPAAAAARVASAMARSLAPPEADDPPADWLWPEQVSSFRRVLAAVRRYGGALLADPVGTGKTYVALAAAATLNQLSPTGCIVPAALVAQWHDASRRVGVPALVWSHERLSRGSVPGACGRFVLVDESHHFRTPTTRRYHQLSRWLVGRHAILITASPVINRLSDLQHQLALSVRDDALARHGVPSIASLLRGGQGHPALGLLVLAGSSGRGRRPGARHAVVRVGNEALAPLRAALAGVDRLRLSTDRSIAGLVRAAFWKAAASSPAALLASVDRYRRLLFHARDAAGAGRVLGRDALRVATGALSDQLLFWELLDAPAGASELALDDLAGLEEVRREVAAAIAAPDPKLERLAALLADRRRTLVFTCARETVRYLRDRLRVGSAAWCTGERAGIGRQPVPRRSVLRWFGPAAPDGDGPVEPLAPRLLLATDVAGEGLDLQRAERVIHYDLPWTPARLEQREGRARRAGSLHDEVEVIQFDPPPAVESRLRQLACLAVKRRLPAAVGLDESSGGLWRWRVDQADALRGPGPAEGVALVRGAGAGVLAGFALCEWPAPADRAPLASWVVWGGAAGGWTDDHAIVAARLARAAAIERSDRSDQIEATDRPTDVAIRSSVARLAPLIRQRMRELRQSRWLETNGGPSRGLVARLEGLAARAARQRDRVGLARLERAMRFVAGGHTAGERDLLARLARASDHELARALPQLPEPSRAWEAIHCRLVGLIVFEP